jgi:4-hydroxybenzoate polyprenyltransferase
MSHHDVPADVLAVDLDGTLLRTDMLHETLWDTMASTWHAPLLIVSGLLGGRAALKRVLAQRATIDVSTLPYDAEVVAFAKDWKARGGRVVLVTAADQQIAEAVAAELGLFDAVHGSDGNRNLKGASKAAFLVERYGKGGYAYIGDAFADLAVWRDAAHGIVRSRSGRLLARAQAVQPNIAPLPGPGPDWRSYFMALRAHQWLKNLLVFVAVLAGHRFESDILMRAGAAFVAFSLIASSVYLLNDLLDLGADRAHPRKRNRPFASGRVPISHAPPLLIALLGGGLAIAAWLGPAFFGTVLVYYAATTAYSLKLKRLPVIDVSVLAGLYTLRVVAGGIVADIPLSVWLIAFSLFLFFSIAAVKRQAELVDAARLGGLQIRGRGYRADDVPLVSQMATSSGYVAVLVVALYVTSDTVARLYSQPAILLGICPILLYWVSRMTLMAHRGQMHDDPLVFAARDRVSLCCALVIGVLVVVAAWI